MQELIDRVSERVGIDQGTAKIAIGHVLIFMRDHAPESKVAELIDRVPWTHEAVEAAAAATDAGVTAAIGGLTDFMGFGHAGLNILGDKLTNLGLNQAQCTALMDEVFGRAEELVGEQAVTEMTTAMPYLSGLMKRTPSSDAARRGA
jgi:hypothetical protein